MIGIPPVTSDREHAREIAREALAEQDRLQDRMRVLLEETQGYARDLEFCAKELLRHKGASVLYDVNPIIIQELESKIETLKAEYEKRNDILKECQAQMFNHARQACGLIESDQRKQSRELEAAMYSELPKIDSEIVPGVVAALAPACQLWGTDEIATVFKDAARYSKFWTEVVERLHKEHSHQSVETRVKKMTVESNRGVGEVCPSGAGASLDEARCYLKSFVNAI